MGSNKRGRPATSSDNSAAEFIPYEPPAKPAAKSKKPKAPKVTAAPEDDAFIPYTAPVKPPATNKFRKSAPATEIPAPSAVEPETRNSKRAHLTASDDNASSSLLPTVNRPSAKKFKVSESMPEPSAPVSVPVSDSETPEAKASKSKAAVTLVQPVSITAGKKVSDVPPAVLKKTTTMMEALSVKIQEKEMKLAELNIQAWNCGLEYVKEVNKLLVVAQDLKEAQLLIPLPPGTGSSNILPSHQLFLKMQQRLENMQLVTPHPGPLSTHQARQRSHYQTSDDHSTRERRRRDASPERSPYSRPSRYETFQEPRYRDRYPDEHRPPVSPSFRHRRNHGVAGHPSSAHDWSEADGSEYRRDRRFVGDSYDSFHRYPASVRLLTR
ncbi:hypothetical protein C8J56DRAFT_386518 [Mycena floridula]|nr:hypothetical protein C8J56DRAFT_386518 [Mycena floridula]